MWGLPKGELCEANDVLEKQSTASAIECELPKKLATLILKLKKNQTASSENEGAIGGGHKRRMRPGGESEERFPDNDSRIASFGCPPCCASSLPPLVANFTPYPVRAKPWICL